MRHMPVTQLNLTCSNSFEVKHTRSQHRPVAHYQYATGKCIGTDRLRPLPPSVASMNTILTIIDAGPRYLITIPETSGSSAACTLPLVLNQIMYIRGHPPHIMVTDNVRELVSSFIQHNCAKNSHRAHSHNTVLSRVK